MAPSVARARPSGASSSMSSANLFARSMVSSRPRKWTTESRGDGNAASPRLSLAYSTAASDPDRSGGEIHQYLGQIHSPIVGAGAWRGVKREPR
jgi:hypothetical protein